MVGTSKERVIIPYGVKKQNIKKKHTAPKPIAIFSSNPMRDLDWVLNEWEKNFSRSF